MTRRLAKRRHAEAPYQPWLRWPGLRTAFCDFLGSSHGLRYSAWSPLWLALVEVVTAGAIGLCAQEVGARICVRHLRPHIVHVILTYPTEKWDLRTGKVAWML